MAAATVSGSKDVEMKDVEEEKKEEEPDPKQVQKDKDLLTFEGKFHLMSTIWWALIMNFFRHKRTDEIDREGSKSEGAQVHPQSSAISAVSPEEGERCDS